MSAPIYSVLSGSSVALAAATAKSVLGVRAHANSGLMLRRFSIGFDGVSASGVPVLCELCYCTFAANAPGTNSTSVTPAQKTQRAMAAGFTAARNWTTEPTAITVIEHFLLTPNSGLVLYDYPLDTEPDSALAEGFVIRCTAPAIVNVLASMDVSRI